MTCSIKKSVCSLKASNDISSVIGSNNLIQFKYGFAEIMTDDQNVSNQICENLNGNSSSNCLSKDQIENLLAKKRTYK